MLISKEQFPFLRTKYQEINPNIDLITWSREIADLDKMRKEFKANFFANFINEKILRRE